MKILSHGNQNPKAGLSRTELTRLRTPGPVLVTKDAIPDPQALSIKAIYNGQTVQDGNTKYVCSIHHLVTHPWPLPVFLRLLSKIIL